MTVLPGFFKSPPRLVIPQELQTMADAIPRRGFLKVAALAALGLVVDVPQRAQATETVLALGRVTISSLRAYDRPSFTSMARSKGYGVDTLINIYEEKADGDPGSSQNPTWWRADEGWVHASLIQPVRNEPNQPILEMPKDGFLAEMTIPFAEAWRNADGTPLKVYRFYYGSTHWVDQVVTDKKGRVWYRVLDDRYKVYYFVLAESLRRVNDDQLTPISPDVADKLIEVDLKRQSLRRTRTAPSP